jgi:hypothetical protein
MELFVRDDAGGCDAAQSGTARQLGPIRARRRQLASSTAGDLVQRLRLMRASPLKSATRRPPARLTPAACDGRDRLGL